MNAELEFDCGMVVKGVGAPGLACKAHIGKCEDEACQEDVKQMAKKYENVIL